MTPMFVLTSYKTKLVDKEWLDSLVGNNRALVNNFVRTKKFLITKFEMAKATEGYPVANTHRFTNARKIHCSVIVKLT